MDPIDSRQGQDKPSEQSLDLTPSSKGRQRRKNTKYLDYETEDTIIVQTFQQKRPRKSPEGKEAASLKTPEKRGRPKAAKRRAEDEAPAESVEQTAEETANKPTSAKKTPAKKTPAKKTPAKKTPAKKTPAKKTPAKKTPAKKTPAKKTPAKKTPAKKTPAVGEDLAAGEAAKQENGTPKPKRKNVKKQPVPEPEPVKPPAEPEEEPEPGGRRRRGAAKAALKYLQNLAKEALAHPGDEPGSQSGEDAGYEQKAPKGNKVRKGQKRKRRDSDAAEDEDFVPDGEEEEIEEELDDGEEGVESDLDSDPGTCGRSPPIFHGSRNNTGSYGRPLNGLGLSVMRPVWDAAEVTKKFREEHHSSWVFPEWVPSTSDWDPVPQSDVEKYLPQELRSPAFKVSRDGLKKEATPLQTLSRRVPAHPERWDMLLYAGGPVWSLEWCPTPDGAPATQYVALAGHRAMDEEHYANRTCAGPGLVQLWDVGKLEYNSRPDSQPALAYGLAQDHGFIWHLKWCPAGGWELPNCVRKAPFLPRLGLLAVATSNGVVTIYSLPHPDALLSNKKLANSGNDSETPRIHKARGVVTLKLGSFKAPRLERSGLVLSMDWLPAKPHNIMAIGFYDGVVGLWDLSTKSALLRVRESDKSLSLLPYRSFFAHDHAVRAVSFCPAARHLLSTAGEDRFVKTWDLRRLYEPVTVQKRYLTNEIHWPLDAPGVLLAQEVAYVPKYSQGVHYYDHNMRSLFAVPRQGTLWSISYTQWLNSIVTSDSLGDVIFAVLPHIYYSAPYLKRTKDRRFPVYLASLVPREATEGENREMGGAENEEEEEEEEKEEEEGEREEAEGGRARKNKSPPLQRRTYKEAVKKFSIHHTDNDLRTFVGNEKRPVWKRMNDTELKTKMNLDEMPLAALHKVRFNPNMSGQLWVASAGQSGLVRLNCVRGMISPQMKKMIEQNRAQFEALYSPEDPREPVRPEPESESEPEPL
ncbi:general transcription factor 3C polypeptide 2 [Embiotoca jacksoni]|uniref:general transcription factor 3C polypeptide 2 n=1 Tax=Embiotoca jacksoni TaxID=100190 RepID=UPI003704B467